MSGLDDALYWTTNDDTEKINIDGTWLLDLQKELEQIEKEAQRRVCECGAHATSFSQAHAFWCPAYKNLMR